MRKKYLLRKKGNPISIIQSKTWFTLLSVFLILLLSACGSRGDDAGKPTLQKGIFLDSAVEGLHYQSGEHSGTTDANGTFFFEAGQSLRFSLGGIVLGEAVAQAVMTPVELVQGAEDETHPTVVNISRFLQSLDDDDDLSNGIRISQEIRSLAEGQTFNFEIAEADFETEVFFSVLGISQIPSVVSVQAHLRETLLRSLVGTYAGTYSGTSSGTWTFTIDSSGNLSGTDTETGFPDGPTTLSGSISSNGRFDVLGSSPGGKSFSGSTTRSGEISGAWQDISEGNTGTFRGMRVESSEKDATPGILSLSGPDASVFGEKFRVNQLVFEIGQFVIWRDFQTISQSRSISAKLELTLNTDGTVKRISLNRFDIDTRASVIHSTLLYHLECDGKSGDCSSISLDGSQKTISFSNTSLPVDDGIQQNDALGPLIINGILEW